MKRISELLAPLFKKGRVTENQLPDNNVNDFFIQKGRPNNRMCIYVRAETHDIITKIVKTNPNPKLTIGGLVDDILMEYLISNKDEINKLYCQDRSDLIEIRSEIRTE